MSEQREPKGIARLLMALGDLTDEMVELSTWKPGSRERIWRVKANGCSYDGSTPFACIQAAWTTWIDSQFRDEVQ